MNFQNIPRGDKVVKKAFVPKLDAFAFFDYSQIELRLLAFYMGMLGDHSMANAFKAGTDMHTASTQGALKIAGEPTDEERQVGKTLNYSIVYGGGTPTLMRQLGIGYTDAREILENYHDQWPGIRRVQTAIKGRLQERGYITTLFGRHLHPESDHKALNALIQGCAADLLRMSAVKVHDFMRHDKLESHIVNLIHDEIMCDAVAFELPILAQKVPLLMGDGRIEEIVPVVVDMEVSYSTWAEKEPYDTEADRARAA